MVTHYYRHACKLHGEPHSSCFKDIGTTYYGRQHFLIKVGLLFFLILFAISFINKVHAQSAIAIRTGLNNSWLYEMGSDYRYGYPEFDSKPAYYFGLSFYRSKHKLIRLESSIELCSKFVSIFGKTGGIASYSISDEDFKLYYVGFSVYPVVRFGKKIEFIGSVRPYFSKVVASSRIGTGFSWAQNPDLSYPPVTDSITYTGAADEFWGFSIDVAFNLRVEYPVTNRLSILVEGQYSKGIINISSFGEFQYSFKNITIGTGVVLSFSKNNSCNSNN